MCIFYFKMSRKKIQYKWQLTRQKGWQILLTSFSLFCWGWHHKFRVFAKFDTFKEGSLLVNFNLTWTVLSPIGILSLDSGTFCWKYFLFLHRIFHIVLIVLKWTISALKRVVIIMWEITGQHFENREAPHILHCPRQTNCTRWL